MSNPRSEILRVFGRNELLLHGLSLSIVYHSVTTPFFDQFRVELSVSLPSMARRTASLDYIFPCSEHMSCIGNDVLRGVGTLGDQ